jgi:ferrous iron transport protein B
MAVHTICLVGNPNCGKTTLFNALTGARQQVGNWPGVTVERKTGSYRTAAGAISVIDLPGVYSLGVTSVSSLDERIARDFVLSGDADVVVNILDASNLERNLYLTTQLLEMRLPMVVVLNMLDVARDQRITIDVEGLAMRLGCPVVPIVANRSEGIEHLRQVIDGAVTKRHVPSVELGYSPEIEDAIVDVVPLIADTPGAPNSRWLAVKVLEADEGALALVPERVRGEVARIAEATAERAGEDVDILIADSRYGLANALIRESVTRHGVVHRTLSDQIDKLVLHRVLGIPIFLVVMYLLFLFTINFGGAFIDFFDQFTGTLLVDGGGAVLSGLGSPEWLTTILAGGVGGGIQTVATFIPIIGCLYLFLSFLEDSGYMARAAFVMDRLMRSVGLPGKSFIPLIVGFGCNVPAIMATRTLEHRRDRVITVMMAPFMSCGARLPVYALFAAAFFPQGGQNLVFALYLIGIGFAVMTGFVLKSTLLKGETAPFVMELPPYHLPTLKSVLLRTWDRLKQFIFRAGRVIVPVVVVLTVLGSLGTDGSFGNDNTDRSVLAEAAKRATPVLAPIGIAEDNWAATVGMITGIFAKEAVVGTLDALYGALAEGDAAENGDDSAGTEPMDAPGFDLLAGLEGAFATIPENLADLVNAITDPLGVSIVGSGTLEEAAQEQEVAVGTFGAMAARFDGQVGAFAYLLAVLLYMPCVSAIAAVYRETGAGWTIFASLWTTGLGYGAAVLAYQAGTFSRDPTHAGAWIAGVLLAFVAALFAFRMAGERGIAQVPAAAAE